MSREHDDDGIVVRMAEADEEAFAAPASAMIQAAAADNDIAPRAADWLAEKIRKGQAAIALRGDELVGFGYFSAWEDGRFVSHSGLVVPPKLRGKGLGRRLKLAVMEASRRKFPQAATMSLTTSAGVRALNVSLGFVTCEFDDLTSDPAFWAGCKPCRNYEQTKREGKVCCCEPMILRP